MLKSLLVFKALGDTEIFGMTGIDRSIMVMGIFGNNPVLNYFLIINLINQSLDIFTINDFSTAFDILSPQIPISSLVSL